MPVIFAKFPFFTRSCNKRRKLKYEVCDQLYISSHIILVVFSIDAAVLPSDKIASTGSANADIRMMALVEQKEKAYYSKFNLLLNDKGAEALRILFDCKQPPATLAAFLNKIKKELRRNTVINPCYWSLLFPSSSPPSSKNFDIPLLVILLTRFCDLRPPAGGWSPSVLPEPTDTSPAADIVRIKWFRKEYLELQSARLEERRFLCWWNLISSPLVRLGIPKNEIDDLKTGCLGNNRRVKRIY